MRRSRHAGALLLLMLTHAHAAEGVKLRTLPPIYADDQGGGLRQPEGVATDGRSLLVVADTGNGRLARYTIAGDTVTPSGEFRLAEIPVPINVQVNSKGDLFVLDGKSRRIARLSSSGEFKGYLQPGGGGADGRTVPRSLRIDRGDNLYLLDVAQARVLVMGPDGGTRRSIPFPAETGFLSDLAIDDMGTVFVIDSVARRVFVARKSAAVFAPLTGMMKAEMAFPTAIAVDGQGMLFIADQHGGGIVILGPDGSFRGRQSGMGWKEGSLRYPTGLCFAGKGMLFVADRENSRVQVFAVSE